MLSKEESKKNRTISQKALLIVNICSVLAFLAATIFFLLSLKYANDSLILRFNFTFPAWVVLSILFFIMMILSFLMFKWAFEEKHYQSISKKMKEVNQVLNQKLTYNETIAESERHEIQNLLIVMNQKLDFIQTKTEQNEKTEKILQ